jgi:hypothetical protein
MRKQRIEYSSPLDALIAVTKRLSVYENKYQWDSEDFFDRYNKGSLTDEIDFIEWSNNYQHYLALRLELANLLVHAA